MNTEKIYPQFLKKLESNPEDQILSSIREKEIPDKDKKFRVIISFETISKRDEFILKYSELEASYQFILVPSLSLVITKEQIENLQDEELIKRIEEDQVLYLSMMDIIESIGLNRYRTLKKHNTGKDVVIGIIDNGVNDEFDTFAGVEIEHYAVHEHDKKDKVTHGTLMANIIVNQFLDDKNNTIGIAPDSKIVDFDISNPTNHYYLSDILDVLEFILDEEIKIDILLISFSTLHPSDGNDILSLYCNLLIDKDIIIACPAGNYGPESYTIGSPAAADKVITFGSHTKNNQMSYFSGRGPTLDERIKPDFCLPGSKIEIPLSEEIRPILSGTSVSAAVGVGIIALLKELDPKMSYIRIFANMKRACNNLKYQNVSQGSGTIYIPDVFKKADIKGIKYKKPKVKREKYRKVKAVKEVREDGEIALSYNDIIRKSLIVSSQFLFVLILIFYIVFNLENIIGFFSVLFGGS